MSKPINRRVILAAAFGNILEFFEFSVYNFFVGYISVLFFPPVDDPNIALLYAFATFGVSFFMRPLGGILIGAYADRVGRRKAMILTILLMSLGTLMIAIAPTFATAGYWGTVTLVMARLIQGLAAGGETGASLSMLVESAPNHRRGFYGSWALASQGFATVFGAMWALGFSAVLPGLTDNPDVMSEWGWRMPFVVGVLLSPIGCWLRLTLTEIPDNVTPSTQPKQGRMALLIAHREVIVVGIFVTIGSTVAVYISNFYYANFAVAYLGFAPITAHFGMLLAGSLTFSCALLFGHLSDKLGRVKLILWSRIAMLLLAFPSFWLLVNYPTPLVLFSVIFVMVTFTILGASPAMFIITELLPKPIRALGFSIIYSVGVALFGGFAQFFATQAIALTGSLTAPAWYLIGGTLLSLTVMGRLKEPQATLPN